MNTTITTLIEKGIADKHLAGAIVQVTQKEEPFFQEAFGIHSLNDRIDAGNLVEVVAILPLILKLVERRRSKLALNHKLSLYFPEFKQDGKENVQIMNLLTHTSGLSAQDITQDLAFQPGSKVEYNAQNFKILPTIFEKVSGYSFHTYYQERLLDLLLMSNTDLTKEYKLLTTIPDLSHFATMVAQDGTFDFIKVINWKAVQLSKQNFTSFLNEDRGLGWAIQKDSKTAYGYLDEPTTSMWFIPEKEYNIVLHLTPFSEGEEEGLLEIRKKILSLLEKQD